MDSKMIGTVFTIALVGGAAYLWSLGSNSRPGSTTPPMADRGSEMANTTSAPSANDLVRLTEIREFNQQQEAVALARSMYVELDNTGNRVSTRLDELRRSRDQWNTQITGLLANEDGRFIAADRADVSAFRAHYEHVPALPDADIDGFESSLDTMLEPIRNSLHNQSVTGTPNPEFGPRLKSLDSQIQSAEKPFRESIPAIEAILAAAKVRGQRGTQTLQEVLDEMIQGEAVTRAARIEAARKKAEEDVTQQLAQAAQDVVNAEGEKKRQELVSEAERLKAQSKADTLKARATNPDTLRRLEPFVSKSRKVLDTPNPFVYQWRETNLEIVPLSLGAISRHRALEPTEDGLYILNMIATMPDNDRPKWPVPNTPEGWKEVREAQTLLVELGPTLVELSYLAP